MGADLGVPLSDLRPLCVSVAGGESRKTFTQFSKRENVKTIKSDYVKRLNCVVKDKLPVWIKLIDLDYLNWK